MSESAPVAPVAQQVAQPPRGGWAWLERLLARAGDRLNPILVKETRQALKSRQFTVTFALLLLVAWGWSMFGLAMMGPEAASGMPQAHDLFTGYYAILAFCLLVIVPFGAFRSLAGEQEDRTYELLSITTLGPRQIVTGKLGSAVLQMLIYLSAISPCLAFTYMLRGIAFPTILFILFYTVLTSLALALVGLFVGTLTSEKHWQVVLSVGLIVGLMAALITACTLTFEEFLRSDVPFGESEFWIGMGACLTAYGSYFVLLLFATAAQLTFAAENRSTLLRVTMLGQYVLFAAWMSVAWIEDRGGTDMLFVVFLSFVGLHWYVMGALMIGETPDLSPRVRRRLPRSFLGRALLTWFNPGPATGYLFALCGMASGLVLACLAIATHDLFPSVLQRPLRMPESVIAFGVLELCYMAIFLGLGLLLMRAARRFTTVRPALSVLVQAVLVLLACGVPWVIQMSSSAWYESGYSLLQASNVLWTLVEVGEGRGSWTYEPALLLLIPAAALVVFALNLRGIVREALFARLDKPKRVAEEDAQEAARGLPAPQPVQISPWDFEMPKPPGEDLRS